MNAWRYIYIYILYTSNLSSCVCCWTLQNKSLMSDKSTHKQTSDFPAHYIHKCAVLSQGTSKTISWVKLFTEIYMRLYEYLHLFQVFLSVVWIIFLYYCIYVKSFNKDFYWNHLLKYIWGYMNIWISSLVRFLFISIAFHFL